MWVIGPFQCNRSTLRNMLNHARPSEALVSLDFEVFGKVQKVFFRKHTQLEATRLGLVGFVRNTASNTVVGTAQGSPAHINEFRIWLREKGSPRSRIDDCQSSTRAISATAYSAFTIQK
ncbi:Acylphosphatase-1 [Kappamyces sp. JEL0680]|nr:Acylphosphatase-1 [Kappamyces sp. JEL0680]